MINFSEFSTTPLDLGNAVKAMFNYRNNDSVDRCEKWLQHHHSKRALLTKSCTAALEMSALLLDIQPGDEVIVPTYTFVSTASAFALRGARLLFCDCDKSFNIDVNHLRKLVTSSTKAIAVTHYGSGCCDMDAVMSIAGDIPVVEDCAHGFLGEYDNKPLGSFGRFGTLSFHETKNISCGEGGALLLGEADYERACVLFDKGTNRRDFTRGLADKYVWVDHGSSFNLNRILASVLFAQLQRAEGIQLRRMTACAMYTSRLADWCEREGFTQMSVCSGLTTSSFHIAHMLAKNVQTAKALREYAKARDVQLTGHYVPLHMSPFAVKHYGTQHCPNASGMYDRIVRLPLHDELDAKAIEHVVRTLREGTWPFQV